MLEEIRNYLKGETAIREIVICVLDTTQYEAFKTQIENMP
jgi:hypothetical protein